jgi:hypothetical protein
VKKTLFATTLVLALSLTAAAQKKPAISQHLGGGPEQEATKTSVPATPPSLCNPCLFYGGDLNPLDPNAAGMSNENTLIIVGGSSTYAAFNVPSGITATITGILFNIQASANFDPQTATYDVRTGVIDGNGGTSIASGSGNITVATTGRNFIGLNEFSVLVNLSTPLTIGTGEYWFNITPQCTNGDTDGSCNQGRIFLSNTTEFTNGVLFKAQPAGSMFLNSSFFELTYANWCDAALGFNAQQCNAASFGLVGTAKK